MPSALSIISVYCRVHGCSVYYGPWLSTLSMSMFKCGHHGEHGLHDSFYTYTLPSMALEVMPAFFCSHSDNHCLGLQLIVY